MTEDDNVDIDGLLAEQIEYYRARAPEYDEWWVGEGRWDLGPEHNRLWLEPSATCLRGRGHFAGRLRGAGKWQRNGSFGCPVTL